MVAEEAKCVKSTAEKLFEPCHGGDEVASMWLRASLAGKMMGTTLTGPEPNLGHRIPIRLSRL